MAFNGTAPYAVADLYAGTDFTSLNWLEQQWVAWYIWIGNPVVATGLASFLLHEVCIVFRKRQRKAPSFPTRSRSPNLVLICPR